MSDNVGAVVTIGGFTDNVEAVVTCTLDEDGNPVPVSSSAPSPISLTAVTDAGNSVALSATGEGHLEVALHAPRLPFGSVHVESLRPIFQSDAVYGINANQILTTTNSSGSATASNSEFTVSTGTTVGGFGTIQSRKRLRYRPGQGAICRFSARFTAGVASSIQVAGCGHAEDGFYFGYNGTSFGILHVARGVREVRTLTVTTASTSTSNYNVQLNGTTFNVTATNNGTTTATAYEISRGTFTGWKAEAVGSTVLFIKDTPGAATGTYSLAQSGAGTPAAGSFVQTKAGVASTDTWVAQSSWNGDKLDGTGPSGVTLDPTKGNVFQIGIQYLGYGPITFSIEAAPSGNNPDMVVVHTIRYNNTNTSTSVGNPAFPFTMAAYSAGSSTNVSVYSGSFAGFIEGEKQQLGPRMCYANSITTATAGAYQAAFTVRNNLYHGGRSNHAVINLISILCALKHTQPATAYLIRNGTLGGSPNFASYDSTSCACYDTSATTVSFTNNSQVIFTAPLSETGSIPFVFGDTEITIQPGETLTLAFRTVTGTAAYCIGSLNTREDQ